MQITTDLGQSSSGLGLTVVQGDTKPPLVINLAQETTNYSTGLVTDSPIDVSTSTVLLKIRKVGSNTLIDTITCINLPGFEYANGVVNLTPPFNMPGKGGRIMANWKTNSLSVAGVIEGEVEITYPDGTIQTAANVVKLRVKPQF